MGTGDHWCRWWICGLFELLSDKRLGWWSEGGPEGVKMVKTVCRSQVGTLTTSRGDGPERLSFRVLWLRMTEGELLERFRSSARCGEGGPLACTGTWGTVYKVRTSTLMVSANGRPNMGVDGWEPVGVRGGGEQRPGRCEGSWAGICGEQRSGRKVLSAEFCCCC